MFSSTHDILFTASAFPVDHLSDAELVRNVEMLKKQVRILRVENEILDASIMRLQPSLMTGAQTALESAIKLSQYVESRTFIGNESRTSRLGLHDTPTSSANMSSRSKTAHWKSTCSIKQSSSIKFCRSILGTPGPKINIEERLELVHFAMEAQGNDLKKARKDAKKKHAYLISQLEELEIRSKYIDECAADFEYEVLIEGVEALTKRIPAETWIRFLTDHGKKVDSQIHKMRLRTSTLNTQYKKLTADIKVKEDLVERIMPIDFETIAIKRAIQINKLEIKTKDLIAQKVVLGDNNLAVTRFKYDLINLTNYLHKAEALIEQRNRQTKEIYAEKAKLELNVDKLERQLNLIKKHRDTYFVPDLYEYIGLKIKRGMPIRGPQWTTD